MYHVGSHQGCGAREKLGRAGISPEVNAAQGIIFELRVALYRLPSPSREVGRYASFRKRLRALYPPQAWVMACRSSPLDVRASVRNEALGAWMNFHTGTREKHWISYLVYSRISCVFPSVAWVSSLRRLFGNRGSHGRRESHPGSLARKELVLTTVLSKL